MHSGADVEAFTATLNRDIEGIEASCSQQPHSDSPVLSQENNQTSSQMYSQWQPSNRDENKNNQCQQLEFMNQEPREQQPLDMEMKKLISSVEVQREGNGSLAPRGLPIQYKPMQVDSKEHQVKQNSGEFSQSLAAMQVSRSGHAQSREAERMLILGRESQFSNMKRISNQPVLVPEEVGNSGSQVIPFGSLLPIILAKLDKDKAMQLNNLFSKLRKNEIPKESFVRLMRNIVGDQMLRLAVVKMQAKGNKNPDTVTNQFQAQSQNLIQQHLRPPCGTASNFSDPYSFRQLHQNSHSIPAVISRTPASLMQQQKESSHRTVDNSAFKPREVEHLTGSHGTQTNQMSDRSAIRRLTKQQLQHLHFPPSFFPKYGVGGYIRNEGTSSTIYRPQSHDPQMRQVQLHQRFGSTNADGTCQALNVVNFPKFERPNSFSDPRVLGATIQNMSSPSPMPHSSVTWQPMRPAFSGAVQAELEKSVAGTSHDESSDRRPCVVAFPSTRTPTVVPSSSVASHVPPSSEADIQPHGTKKPSGVQKKPLDSHTSSPPLPSKKQKVSGALCDQSIEHLNDVTANSEIDLREEEEQLFSIPKDDSRVSEASRRAVQEEEDRLILQKIPLQKKLSEIMTKCGLKNLGNDVERCLSLCVEERLSALISSLIRVSKQRVDSEKSRHNTFVISDVREQILAINRNAREEWGKKQAEAEKLRKHNDPNNNTGVDGEKEKDDGRGKLMKSNKEDDDKMRTTAANVAARAAVGGDDMLSKWQLMAQARQKCDGGPETGSISQTNNDANNKPLATSAGNAKDTRTTGKKDHPTGAARQFGRSLVLIQPPISARNISIRDVIAVLEREPQMAKSTVTYRLYEKVHADAVTE